MRQLKILFCFLFIAVPSFGQFIINPYLFTTAPSTPDPVVTLGNDVDVFDAYILLNYNKGVYTSGGGGVQASDYSISFAANGGTATNAVIASVKNTANGTLTGGEFTVRVNLTITGNVSGTETVTIQPSSGTAIKSYQNGYAAVADNTTVSTLIKTYDADYQTVLSYHLNTTQGRVPSWKYRNAENDWLIAVKATGEFATLDLCYRMSKYGDQNYSLLNWKSPGSKTLTITNQLTWTYGSGFGFANQGYLETGYTPSTDAVNFTQNDGAVFHASETDVQDTNFDYGVASTDNLKVVALNPRNSGTNTASIALNSAQAATSGGVPTSQGTFLNSRTGSTGATHKYYINGTVFDASNFASAGLPNQAMVIGGRRGNTGLVGGATNRKVSLFMIGASMDTNVAALNTAETTYTTALAAVSYAVQLTSDDGTDLTTDDSDDLTTD